MTTTSDAYFRADRSPARDTDVSSPLLGLIFTASAGLFGGTIAWIASGQALFLLQLPLLLFSLFAVMCSGFLYFINPSRWLPFFLLGLVYFSFEFTIRDPRLGGGFDAQSMIKGVLSLALAMVGIFTAFRKVFATPLLLLFFVYSFMAFLSSFYSPVMVVGIPAGITLVGVTVVTARLGTGTEEDILKCWRVMYWASVLTCLLSFAVLAIAPGMSRDMQDPTSFRLRGVTGAANALGPIMAIACVMSILMYKRTRTAMAKRFHVVMFVLFAIALFLTNSRSSILGLIAGLGVTMLVGSGLGVLGLLAVLSIGVVAGSVMLYPGLQNALLSWAAALFSRTGEVYELTSFTGRQGIWQASWQLIDSHPWIGYGLSSVRLILSQSYFDEWGNTVGTAHNWLLESLLTVGWIGTAPLIAVVSICLWKLMRYVMSTAPKLHSVRSLPKAAESPTYAYRDLGLCACQTVLIMVVQGFSEKGFAGHPSSSFLALGAVVATTTFLALNRPTRPAAP
ncbi:MAG: O-antigen ligase family protein [Rubrivivax sp.]|nr:MAG: O-antigen ligase family protein [Rubrivivax sp.]